MAYRIKGVLTLKQRRELSDFIDSYHALVSDTSIPATVELLKATNRPIVVLAAIALYVDSTKIQEKIIGVAK